MATEPNNVNCLNARAIIEYIRRHHPGRIAELIDGLPRPVGALPDLEEFLCDENNWVPSGLLVVMFENAKRITGNSEIAFSIGFESITHKDLGYAQRLFLTLFASPRSMLRAHRRLNEKLNRTKRLTLVSDTALKAVLRWDWFEGVNSSHDVCLYNRGIYSALPTLWGYAPAQVEESPCRFEGGKYCEITITWGFGVGRIRGILERITHHWKRSEDGPAQVLEDALRLVEKDKDELKKRSDELQHKVEILKAINMVMGTLVSSPNTRDVLEKTLRPMITALGFNRAIIMSYNEQKHELEYLHGVGGVFDDLDSIKNYRIPLVKGDTLVGRVFNRREPIMIQDASAAGLNPANRILRDFQPGPFIACPMFAGERIIGILGVDRLDRDRLLVESDAEYVSIFANNIAAAFERARLDKELRESYEEQARIQRQSYEERARIQKQRSEELRASYEGAVGALVKAIEVNDELTGEHSDRVSKISVKIAGRLGYNDSQLKDIQFGCILHDVGKIGLASWLELKKPGPLTDEEYETIKQHPVRGEEILKANVTFKDMYRNIVLFHHERWDGKGYPEGRSGDKIPLESQIVAVADAFDAMTTDRRYKKAVPYKQAVEEIIRCSGTQFSPKVVTAFLQLYEQKGINVDMDISKQGG